MSEVTTIGLDIAKHVFQIHGVDAGGAVVIRRRLRRSEVPAFFECLGPGLVGIEACATPHYWARLHEVHRPDLVGCGGRRTILTQLGPDPPLGRFVASLQTLLAV